MQAVSINKDSFTNRIDLKHKGLRGGGLDEAAGITDGIFVHATGFIGAAKSLESVLKIVTESMAEHKAK